MTRNAFLILLSIAVWSCDKPKDATIGPCMHTYEDPVLHVASVTNAQNGQQVVAFRILEVTRNGMKQQPVFLKIVSYNVVAYDTTLVCNLPCGFGTDEGVYTLLVSALGYRDTIITVTGKYAVFKGGCPSSNSGGTKFSFRMQAQ
jgi:hypothetical protein